MAYTNPPYPALDGCGGRQPEDPLMYRCYAEDIRAFMHPDGKNEKGILVIQPAPAGAGVYLIAGGGTADYERLIAELVRDVRVKESTISRLQSELNETQDKSLERAKDIRIETSKSDRLEVQLTNEKQLTEQLRAALETLENQKESDEALASSLRNRIAGLEQLVRNLRSTKARVAARKRKKAKAA